MPPEAETCVSAVRLAKQRRVAARGQVSAVPRGVAAAAMTLWRVACGDNGDIEAKCRGVPAEGVFRCVFCGDGDVAMALYVCQNGRAGAASGPRTVQHLMFSSAIRGARCGASPVSTKNVASAEWGQAVPVAHNARANQRHPQQHSALLQMQRARTKPKNECHNSPTIIIVPPCSRFSGIDMSAGAVGSGA